jgi:hypothetical protein
VKKANLQVGKGEYHASGRKDASTPKDTYTLGLWMLPDGGDKACWVRGKDEEVVIHGFL